MLPQGMVLVTEKDGAIAAIVNETDAGIDVQDLNGILCPGFINAHCHIELSHMKGIIAEHGGLVNFVQQVMLKRKEIHREEIFSAMLCAENELYNSGTVAVGDICNGTDSVELKKKSLLYWHNFIEVSGFTDAVAQERLKNAEDILLSFVNSHPALGNSLSPHAPYSVSKKMFELINEKTAGQIISIHNQEAAAENELYQYKTGNFLNLYKNLGIDARNFLPTGKTSMQSWMPYFTNKQKIIAVHNTFTSAQDMDNYPPPTAYCICINANIYIENKLPPVDLLIKNNCPIALGTDSYASNRQLNMMEEIKSIQKYFPHIALQQILQWATLNGAKALGIENTFGSFEKGKKPGLVLIDIEKGVSKKIH